MGSTTRKTKKGKAYRGEALLDELERCLSEGERHEVLVAALLSLDEGGRERLVDGLDGDTGVVLLRMLEGEDGPDRRRSRRVSRSQDRILQEWHAAWKEWDAAIGETQWEHGQYVCQEHDWDPPYLDQSALARDLEEVAGRLLELMPRVIEEELDPDFSFLDQIRGSAEDAGAGLPEWFEEPDWDSLFGPVATSCLLHWEWFASAQGVGEEEPTSPFEILDRIRRAENESRRWCVDTGALLEFVLALDEDDQREILRGIVASRDNAHWQRALDSAHGTWFDLTLQLAEQWEPALYLDLCRSLVRRDWVLAIPVLEVLLEQRAFGEAGPVIEDALSSLLRRSGEDPWSPTETLLVSRRYTDEDGDPESALVRLLESWARIAGGLEQTELHHALEIQVAACRGWARWDPMLAAFERATVAGFDLLADRLFEDWKQLITRRTHRESRFFTRSTAERRLARLGLRPVKPPAEPRNWVPLLVDGARAGRKEAARFRDVLAGWIEDVTATPEAFRLHRCRLELLTLDLDDGTQLRRASRTFCDTLERERGAATVLDASRRAWLDHLGARRLLPTVIATWRTYADELPGDPRGGDYRRCALWLKIAFDLDQDAGERVLAAWRIDHRRRRNLWKALEDRGLPGRS